MCKKSNFEFIANNKVKIIYRKDHQYLLGTPETKRSGLKTLNARRALTSRFRFKFERAVLIILKKKKKKKIN
jgi:hypothetical protein